MKHLSVLALSIALIVLLSMFSTRFAYVEAGSCNVTTTFNDNPSSAGSIEAGPTGSTGGSISSDNIYVNGQSATYPCQTINYCVGHVCTYTYTSLNVTSLPVKGYTFVNWTVSGTARVSSITANPATITLTANKTSTVTITAAYVKNPIVFHSVYFTNTSPQAAIRTINWVLNATTGSRPSASSVLLYRSTNGSLTFSNVSSNNKWFYVLIYTTLNQGLNITVRTVLQATDSQGHFNATTSIKVVDGSDTPIGDQFVSNSSMTFSQYYSRLSGSISALGNTYLSSSNQTLVQLGKEWVAASQSLIYLSASVASNLSSYNITITISITVLQDCAFCEFLLFWAFETFCWPFYFFGILIGVICEIIFVLIGWWLCTFGCATCGC